MIPNNERKNAALVRALQVAESEKGKKINLDSILALTDDIKRRAENWKGRKPPFVIFDDGKSKTTGVVKAGQLTVIQGAYGTHKSRVTETIAALLISENNRPTGDFLGFKKSTATVGRTQVLYIDTERERSEELPEMYVNMHRIAGYEPGTTSKYFTLRTISNVERGKRLETVRALIDYEREQMNARGIGDWGMVAIIDVITDAVHNFNNESEALALFDYLKKIIDDTNTAIICVVHENPGTNKARGHVGSEAWNKSNYVIALKKDGRDDNNEDYIFKMDFLKTRGYKIPNSAWFAWNPASEWIVRVKSPDREDSSLDIHEVMRDIISCFADGNPTTADLREAITARAKDRGEELSRDALMRRIKAVHQAGLINIKEKGKGNKPDTWEIPELPF